MGTIEIKDLDVLRALLRKEYHVKLVEIIIEIALEFEDITFTDGFRLGDSGVHGTDPCRGIDIRSWIYDEPQKICDFVNNRWQYDPNRPTMSCAMLHDVGGGIHFHLQVHPNTIRKE